MDEDKMAARILNLTLEILFWLTGENYMVVKKISGKRRRASEQWRKNANPSMESSLHSQIQRKIKEQKILDLTNKIIELLSGEVPIRCQDVAVYFSMEEWEYIEGHRDLYEDIMENKQTLTSPASCNIGSSRWISSTIIDFLIDLSWMTGKKDKISASILNFTLEILFWLTGEDYTIVKKTSELRKTRNPIMELPSKSWIHRETSEQKILDLTNNIIELLRGEVPIRCQDVTVHFSMEEWEYLEEHKHLYKGVMVEDHRPLASPDGRARGSEEHRRTLHFMKDDCDITQDTYERAMDIPSSLPSKYLFSDSSHTVKQNRSQRRGGKHPKTNTGDKPLSGRGERNKMEQNLPMRQRSHKVEKSFSCSECEKSFRYEKQLVEHHQGTHIGVKPFSCAECGKSFNCKSAIMAHHITHTGKTFSCPECEKSFTHKSYLVKHQRTHIGAKPYKCSECGKCYPRKEILVIHHRTHTGVKPFSCSECGKCFYQKSNLDRHVRIHTGEKPYSCPECGKSFTQKSDLNKHQRSHTGEKPFSCPECGRCFARQCLLAKHQRTHRREKPFSCPDCGKCFAYKLHLHKHKKAHKWK
ncbi:uncharacterized protein RB166_018825 isoform 3-T3 [Leptodactylus fuscus]